MTDDERAEALAALAANGGDVGRTARQLGIPKTTLIGGAEGTRHPEAVGNATPKKEDMNAPMTQPLTTTPDVLGVAELEALLGLAAEAEPLPPCRAGCGRRAERQRGGLCRSCSRDAAVKLRFPSSSKYARRGVGAGCRGYRLPDAPTSAAPGSPEKVAVLEERARLGLALWHPDDAPMDAESRQLGVG